MRGIPLSTNIPSTDQKSGCTPDFFAPVGDVARFADSAHSASGSLHVHPAPKTPPFVGHPTHQTAYYRAPTNAYPVYNSQTIGNPVLAPTTSISSCSLTSTLTPPFTSETPSSAPASGDFDRKLMSEADTSVAIAAYTKYYTDVLAYFKALLNAIEDPLPPTDPNACHAQAPSHQASGGVQHNQSMSTNGTSHSTETLPSLPPPFPTTIDDFDLMYNSVLSAVALDPIPLDTVLPSASVVGPVAHDQLKTLLNSFPDLFAWSTDTIGRTHLIQHTIDTGDAKPEWQPPRRIPVRYREEVNKMLDELLQAKIMQPSSSP
nr:unnamed protein product [Spirometra erinaceieuropaei]